jgi:glycolate oxidase
LAKAALSTAGEDKVGIAADAAALLLARVDTPGDSGRDVADAIAAALTDAGAQWVVQSTDAAESEAREAVRRALDPLGLFNPGKG